MEDGMEKDVSINVSSNFLEVSEITPTEYKEKLIFLLQPILDRQFEEYPKRKIKLHHNRITFACPYCKDSMKNLYAKRGNFILEGKFVNTFKCFNCDHFCSIQKFFEDFKGELDIDMIEHISRTTVDFENYIQRKYDMGFLLDREEIGKYAIKRETIKKAFGLIEVEQNERVWKWLKARMQFQKERFLYSPKKNYLAILNMYDSEKIIGLQRRNFEGSKGQRYLTYKLSKLYELFGIKHPIPDYIDSVSTLFGILETNFAKPITLFEGPMDSFLFKNSVASSGASKTFPVDIPLRYWFDDDKTGREKSIQYIEKGQPVFLWGKFKRDHGIPHRNKWDLNDILIWAAENNKKNTFNFDLFFSDNPLDIIDV